MLSFFAYFARHRTAANLIMAAALIGGLYAALEIRKQFFPDVAFETATVRVTWDGAGPEEIDDAVIAALEPSLRAIDGVEETRTLAREGLGSVVLTFESGTDMQAAMADVEAAVDGVTTLPEGTEEPEISRGRFRDRVTNVVVSGPVPVTVLAGYAQDAKDALFDAGVTRVTLRGLAAPDIVVEPSEEALRRHNLTFTEIAQAITADAASLPAGSLDAAGARVRAGADRRSVRSLREITVRAAADGSRLRLIDVAEIRDLSGDPLGPKDSVTFFAGGAPAVELRVERNADGDGVAIQRTVERVVDELRKGLPEGVEMRLTRTRSQAIIDRLDLLVRNGGSGLLVVLTLLFLFLSARTAFWVAAGIPTAMLATVGLMFVAGYSLNMLSLFALILCLGIVVDDAIVVGEHADHLARKGLSPEDAAVQAARRMWPPVFSASITTVIAFSALVLISGRFGSWLVVLPITVACVIIASLIECFLVLPAHMKHALSARKRRRWYDAPSRVVNGGFNWFRAKAFAPLVRGALRLRFAVVAGAIGLLISSAALQTSGGVKWFFIKFPEMGTIQSSFAMLPGATREDTFEILEEMRRALEATNAAYAEKYGQAPVVDAIATLGGGARRGLATAETKSPDLLGGFEVELIDRDLREYSAFKFLRDWRAEIRPHPRLEAIASRGDRSGPGGDAIEVEISGAVTVFQLKEAAEALKAELGAQSGVSALEDSMAYDEPTRQLSLTAKGAALGFTTDALAREVRARLEGVEALWFPAGELEGRIRVLAPEAARHASYLYDMRVTSGSGVTAPLLEAATLEEEPSFNSIKRLDGRRIVTVNGDIVEDPATRDAVRKALETEILPRIEARYDVDTRQGGLREQERTFLNDALAAFLLCLGGIYIALAWIFGSWSRPFVVMLAIPFGYIGAVWGHYWHDTAMTMFSVVGLIGMSGIIINDSIVLVTTIDEKARTRPIFEAVVEGAADRLRAVFLTTATTAGGLAPLLFETSTQAQFLKPTVITLAYGLGFGMVIVLVLTPALILITHDLGRRLAAFRRLLRWMVSRRRTGLGAR